MPGPFTLNPGMSVGVGAPSVPEGTPTLGGDLAMTLGTVALGTIAFSHNPTRIHNIRKQRTVASTKTWSSNQLEDYGFITPEEGLIGLECVLEWTIMVNADWEQLKSFYEHDDTGDPIVWDAKARAHDVTKLYHVKFVNLDHEESHRLRGHTMKVKATFNIRKVINA